MHKIIQDLRYGFRLFIKSPFFTTVAILSLGLGIGASTSVFSFFNERFFTPMPAAVKDPDRLARIYTHYLKIPAEAPLSCSYPDYLMYKENNPAFSDMLAYSDRNRYGLSYGKHVAYIEGSYVSGNYFSLLGVDPQIGRTIVPQDDQQGNGRSVAVISNSFWKFFFKSDPLIVGSEIQLNRIPFTIVGVLPKNFGTIRDTPEKPSTYIYVPAAMQPQLEPNKQNFNVNLIGRLNPGANLAQAQAVMQTRFKKSAIFAWNAAGNMQIRVSSANQLRPSAQRQLYKMVIVVLLLTGFILWIPCANVSSLLLARAIERRKEIAVRAAMGAGRRRIVRQLITEALVLGALAGVAGPLLASWIIQILAGHIHLQSALLESELSLDKKALCFTAGISILTSLIFGLIPALHTMRVDLTSALKDQETFKFKAFRLLGTRNLLVIANIAVSLAVLAIAGLVVQNVEKSNRVELPLDPDTLLKVSLHLNNAGYGYTGERAQQLRQRLLTRIRSLPRIQAASLAGGQTSSGLSASGRQSISSRIAFTGQDYFKSINSQLIRGRDFSPSEYQSVGDGVIINETMAQLYWPGQEALGQQLRSDRPIMRCRPVMINPPQRPESLTVVGIVRDNPLQEDGYLSNSQKPIAYLPLPESCNQEMTLLVRTFGDASAHMSSIRQIISELEPGLPVTNISRLTEEIEASKKTERYGLAILVALGLLALGLACMGLYAVVSYSVGRRTQEIGIRMALGAGRSTMLRQLIREGLQLTAIGLTIGLFIAWAGARFLQTGDIPITPSDPLMYLAACLLLIPVAVGACYLPARKAVRANPMTALKYE